MHIKKTLLPPDNLKPLYADALKLPFGRTFTDYMFTMEHHRGRGWHDPEIRPYGPIPFDPAANVLHYGQEVFEGMKSYKTDTGVVLMFRPRENAKRFNLSLRRLSMPEVPEEHFLQALCELIRLEERWVPQAVGSSLYIRPAAVSTEAALGVKPAESYLFFIILSPSGPYFAEGFNPVGLWVSDSYTRAAVGGTGEAKTGGNYAGTLLASKIAKDRGFSQVLWLDALEHRYVEEAGAMNIFFVVDGKLVTPKLTGSILQGITRKSILQISSDLGIAAEERSITIDEVVEGIRSGKVTEAFGAGTAAVVSPVGKIGYRDEVHVISEKAGPWSRKLFDTLTGIQYGKLPDKYGWVYRVV